MPKTKKPTKKNTVWALYVQGFGPSSPEVKATGIKYRTAAEYYYDWQKAGMPGYISRQAEEAASKPIPAEPASTEQGATTETKKEEPAITKAPATSVLEASFRVQPKPGFISIGHISIPYEDFGYSSTHNLLLVSATYHQVCQPGDKGGFNYDGKLGDFCADCVELFRRVFKFDKMREEDIRDAEETGVRLLSAAGEGDASEREPEEESQGRTRPIGGSQREDEEA